MNRASLRIFLVFGLLGFTAVARAGDPAKTGNHGGVKKTTANDVTHPMLINNVFNYYSNNGGGSFNRHSISNAGFEWPKGDYRATVMYEDGVVWGCKQRDTVKAGGSVYRHGLQAGPILIYGTPSTIPVADDPSSSANRLYRVRRDIQPIPGVTDPNDPLAAGERAIILSEEVPLIGRYETVTADQLLQQYWNDWINWPADQGAPYTDVDHSGTYNPAIDIPGVPFAGQTLWYVANDCDPGRTYSFAGSTPIGIEMQKTIWAYDISGALGNTIFGKTTLINKSGIPLDSMYVGQWSDPDLGDSNDDFVGCDTLLQFGFAYNAKATDGILGLVPPAVGFDLLQGPVVQGTSTDTAVFGCAYRPGFKNLPMTSFAFMTSSCCYTEPSQGPGGDIQWYRFLRGRIGFTGAPFINPLTGQPTAFTLSGDPVTGSGWIDGNPASFVDRRMLMSSGPFTMAPGDTQEVVVACMIARGVDYLSSITALKAADGLIQRVYNGLFQELPPRMSYSVTTSAHEATISFKADARSLNITGVTLNIKTYSNEAVANVTLADDGLHSDGAAGDGIFGGSVMIPEQQAGLHTGAVITYHSGAMLSWAHVFDNISTAKIAVTSYSVASDNINNDGVPNPGENVRFVFSLTSSSSLALTDLSVRVMSVSIAQHLNIAALAGNTTVSRPYNPNDPTTYLALDVPAVYPESTLAVVLVITDTIHNQWRDTLQFPVKPLKTRVYGTPLTHIVGMASGNFSISIVDSTQVKSHLYVIRGVDTVGSPGRYTLKDSTAGVVLIQSHSLPDSLGHTSPIVDGFKVLLGTIEVRPGMKSWFVPSGTRRFSPVGGGLFGLEGFYPTGPPDAGTIGIGQNFAFGGIMTSVPNWGYHDVLLTWAAVPAELWDPTATPADSNFSRAYRYLSAATAPAAQPSFVPWIKNATAGFAYQDYNYGMPFSAWDRSTVPPTRLAVGHFENNAVSGLVDGRYFPALPTVDNGAADGPREFAFIFATPYTMLPDSQYTINFENSRTPLMWVMTCSRRNDPPYSSSDQFEIIANHLPSPQDAWTFNPSILTTVGQGSIPSSFALMQNYPNPFNPSTTIRYELPEPSKVTMKIYNVLGQEVRTLANEVQNAGPHVLLWNSRNDAGNIVASGVYFYRCTAVPLNRENPVSQTLKMVLVK